jgi:hypothetical protein
MNHQLVESKIGHLRTPFKIHVDGTSQTHLLNNGRFGFFIEKQFGIVPNCDKAPDFGHTELKTIQYGNRMTIGNMTDREYNKITGTEHNYFSTSAPYNKVKNTLLVVYEKLKKRPEPEYVIRNWTMFNLDELSSYDKIILQEDYKFICNYIKKYSDSRDNLTELIQYDGSISGDYLALAYKGSYGYNYPAWGFHSRFMKKLSNA